MNPSDTAQPVESEGLDWQAFAENWQPSARRRLFLITGGCGFIGSHLVDALLAMGHDVRVLDDLSTGKRSNIPEDQVELIIGDVADPATVGRAMKDVDGCFHLAAIASVQRANDDWSEVHRINMAGTVAVFEAAGKAGKNGEPIPVVYASSAAVYGDSDDPVLTEDSETVPQSAYGADKLASELQAHVAGLVHHVPTIGFRFFNVYGPRQDPASPYSGVISIFAHRISEGKPITIYGDGQQTRDFIYVGDVIPHLIAGIDKASTDAPVFNVCTGETTSILELARTIAHLVQTKPKIQFEDARPGDIRHSQGDPSEAEEYLRVSAETELEEGLGELIDSIRV
jgi:UDP-glucose 4-epimerase